MADSAVKRSGRTLTAFACAAWLAGCAPAPELPVAQALVPCAPGLEALPPSLARPAPAGLTAPAIDAQAMAKAECIEATAARHVVELERRAHRVAQAVADYAVPLQRRWWQRAPDDTAVRAWRAHLAAGEQDMAAADAELTRLLDAQYVLGLPKQTLDADQQPLAAVALFDYARTVRAQLRRPLHTRVAGLSANRFCDGAVVQDRLLWGYFDAALRLRGGNRDALADAARALRALALQSACLSEQQLWDLDAALSVAWGMLEDRLRQHNLQALLPLLEPAVLQVRLIVLDANKHLGTSSPGFRWWYGRAELRQQLAQRVQWPFEDFIWLYDRRSAALAALKTTCKDGGSGRDCVNLPVLAESLARPAALGLGECSLLEMVEAGVRSLGGAPSYTCTPGLCGTATGRGALARLPQTALSASFGAALKGAGSGYVLPGAVKQTPFDLAVGDARALLCGGVSGDGFGGPDGSAGMGGPGMGAGGSPLACVVGARAEQMASLVPGAVCIGRYVQATSPLSRAFEQMAPVSYAGVPKGCALSNEGKDGGASDGKKGDDKKGADKKDDKASKNPATVDENFQKTLSNVVEELRKTGSATLENIKKAIQNAYPGTNISESDIQGALADLEKARLVPQKDIPTNKNPDLTTAGSTDVYGNIVAGDTVWLSNMSAGDPDNRNLLLHEFVHALMNRVENRRGLGESDGLYKAWGDYDHKITNNLNLGGVKRCVEGALGCSAGCNGMSVQVQQALACLQSAFSPTTVPPRPQDLVRDPIEPQGARAPQMAACFTSPTDIGGVIAVRQCANVRCADARAGFAGGGCCQAGGLLASSGFGARFTEICTVARCEPQSRTAVGGSVSGGRDTGGALGTGLGMCGCAGSYAPTPGGGTPVPPPETPFAVPLPLPGTPAGPGKGLPGVKG